MINQSNLSTLYVSSKYGDDEATGFYKENDFYKHGPIKTILWSGYSCFSNLACAITGESTGAKYFNAFG